MRQGILVVTAFGVLLASVGGASAQPMPVPVPPPGYYDSRAYYPPPPPVARYAVAPPVEAGMPSYEVARVLHQNGFRPLGGPSRRGDYYTVSAIHPNGDDGRVVIDAYTGRVVRFVPASRFIRDHGGDEMVMVYRGPTFPPPDVGRGLRPPPVAVAPPMGARAPVAAVPPPVIRAQPTARPPQVASRTPATAPVAAPKPRPQAAPKNPATAQAPPATAPPVEAAKPAPVAAPPAETKPVEAKPQAPAAPAIAPTQAMPPVQTIE